MPPGRNNTRTRAGGERQPDESTGQAGSDAVLTASSEDGEGGRTRRRTRLSCPRHFHRSRRRWRGLRRHVSCYAEDSIKAGNPPRNLRHSRCDAIDCSLLRLLIEDARTTYHDLGVAVRLSANTVSDRVRRLRASGVRGYRAELDSRRWAGSC